MILFLLSRGADVYQSNDLGETPLDWATKFHSKKIVKLFNEQPKDCFV